MTDVQQAVPVAGEDREAASHALHTIRGYAVKIGDNHHLVQAFARHRLAALSRLTEPARKADGLGEGVGREAIARIIIGPRNDLPRAEGRPTLRQLQDIRWEWSSGQERKEALWIADRIIAALPDPTHTREAEGENNLPACKTCGAPAGLDCRTGQGRIPPCFGREPATQGKWRERWYGSEPQKGSAIVDERGNLIAYFGGDEATHKATTAAVSAHNAALSRLTEPARKADRLGEGVKLPADIAEHVLSLGRVEWGQTPAHDAEGHGAHVARSVRITAENFGQEGDQHMHGLWLAGTETVLCHTGTSPNAAKTTQALVGAWNWLVDQASTPLAPDPAHTREAEGEPYLVWSNEHRAWWGKDHRGYTKVIANAGRYDRDTALTIAGTRGGGWRLNKGNPDEIAIPEADAIDQYASITDEQLNARGAA